MNPREIDWKILNPSSSAPTFNPIYIPAYISNQIFFTHEFQAQNQPNIIPRSPKIPVPHQLQGAFSPRADISLMLLWCCSDADAWSMVHVTNACLAVHTKPRESTLSHPCYRVQSQILTWNLAKLGMLKRLREGETAMVQALLHTLTEESHGWSSAKER
jgi:hypothetical protein